MTIRQRRIPLFNLGTPFRRAYHREMVGVEKIQLKSAGDFLRSSLRHALRKKGQQQDLDPSIIAEPAYLLSLEFEGFFFKKT